MDDPRSFVCETKEKLARAAGLIQKLPLARSQIVDGKKKTIPLVWQIQVARWRKQRSVTANARLWKLHTLAAEHTGYSPAEMHEHALCRFYGFTERELTDPFTGEIVTKRIPLTRSSDKDTKAFAAFMESTEIWFIEEFGVVLGDQ